jgi:hypothetical protein
MQALGAQEYKVPAGDGVLDWKAGWDSGMRLPSVRCRRPEILRPQLAGRNLFNTAHFKTGWHRQLRALLELASDLAKSAIEGLAAILISLSI